MKLVDNRQPHTVPFGSLKPGDVFYHEEAVGFMMKTTETGCDECSGISNAVSLACGTTYGFEDSEQVEPVDARVEIRTIR